MRTIVSTLLSITIFLATGSALANAQDSGNNPVSQGQVRQLQQKVDAQGHRINGVENSITDLKSQIKTQQGNLGGQIDSVNKQVTDQGATLGKTQTDVTSLRDSVVDNRKDVVHSMAMLWGAVIFFAGALGVIIACVWREVLRNQRAAGSVLLIKDMQQLLLLYNEHTEECLSKQKQLKPEYTITFSVEVLPQPDKGLFLHGIVGGFRAVFERAAFEKGDKYPTIYLNDGEIRFDQRVRFAANILKKVEEKSSKTSQETSPVPAR